LIDVRESFEYEVSNLNGLNIPLSGILIEADKIAKDKTCYRTMPFWKTFCTGDYVIGTTGF
jgi:rhodanese-related sulfurtransferase